MQTDFRGDQHWIQFLWVYLWKVCFVRVVCFSDYIDPESFGEPEDCDSSCSMKQKNNTYFLQINRRKGKNEAVMVSLRK